MYPHTPDTTTWARTDDNYRKKTRFGKTKKKGQQIWKDTKKKGQKGKPTFYNRRKPSQSELKNLNHSKLYLHDFIRMLADPYPNAFIKIGKKKIVFKSSKLDGKKLSFEGEIE